MRTLRTAALAAAALAMLAVSAAAWAQNFKDLEKQVVEKTLPNGLKILILPRPQAPVTSFVTYADVGGVNEIQDATGLAHIFEHMAFKGTTTIGTLDIVKEKAAMAKEDQAFLALRAERLRRPKPDPEKLKQLDAAFKKDQEEAQKFSDTGAFDKVLEINGASGLNAFTSFDQTVYHYSLPSNKLELWAALEGDRFTNPVLREFYKEKDVIMEEKRMGESRPTMRLFNDFFPMAYSAAMYRSWVIGSMSDLQAITRKQATDWFAKYYCARNLTVAIVGDVDPKTAMPILEKYLGAIPAGQKPEGPVTVEPPQRAEKRIIMDDPSQPFLVIGYHRPDINDPDDTAYEVLADVLGGGRSSRLYKSLVKEKKLALYTAAMPTFEGEKFPGIFTIMAVANKGKTNAECEQAIYAELDKIQQEPITAEELEGVKARAKMKFVDSLDSNMGIAMQLAMAQNLEGDWREMFKYLDRIDAVTADDVTRVAKTTFAKSNRTVGMIETTPAKSEK